MRQWPVELRVELDDKEAKGYMRELVRRGSDLQPALKRCGIVMTRSFALNFKQEGRPSHWRPLSANTIAGRRKGSSRILQDTGMLRMSTISRTAPGNIYHLSRNMLKMGSNLKYAVYHQFGTQPYIIRPRNAKVLRFTVAGTGRSRKRIVFAKVVHHPGLPARPFVVIQDEDVKAMREIFRSYVLGE